MQRVECVNNINKLCRVEKAVVQGIIFVSSVTSRHIKKLLSQNNGKWRGRVKEIIDSSQYFKGCRIYGSSQKVGHKIKERLLDMQGYDQIYHSEISKGTGSLIHVFETENPTFKDWS